MTINEIAYDLIDTVRNANVIDDERVDVRQLYYWINNQRSMWLKRKLDTILDIDDNLVQTIKSQLVFDGATTEILTYQTSGNLTVGRSYTIMDLEKGVTDFRVSGSTINRIGHEFVATSPLCTWGKFGEVRYSEVIPTDKNVLLKTRSTIPPTIELNYGNAILEVTSPDLMSKEFSIVPFNQFRFSGNGLFNIKSLFVAIRDNYWYVKYGKDNITPNTIKNIVIRAIFQNPLEVPEYDILTSNYPINNHILDFMKEMIVKSNLQVILGTPSDEANDGSGVIK